MFTMEKYGIENSGGFDLMAITEALSSICGII